ncbi:hypothetical protein FA95DRAFT_1313509 [Auriscalpium vulgare]|uniref:Uncharacterized protein n=1 Tax=Auriscalpium vulgare TaxID=40419 RepID=A0ACB8R247_9AGAM|nr:hypothetical protein FA95DRAFT_1313509 [Auriscalpium vulgare]
MSKVPSKSETPETPKTLSIDASCAPELVEYWAHKYRDVKREMDALQGQLAITPDRDALLGAVPVVEPRDRKPQPAGDDDDQRALLLDARRKIDALNAELLHEAREKAALSARVAQAELKAVGTQKQFEHFFAQCVGLALEADSSRQKRIRAMLPALHLGSFPPAMKYAVLGTEPADLHDAVAIRNLEAYCAAQKPNSVMQLVQRPPMSLPVRIGACGQHGYWYYPGNYRTPFELIIEGKPGEWLYLGRYISTELRDPDEQMHLSEWMSLDELTKAEHCLRSASLGLPAGQYASHAAQLDLKRRYDTGEWVIPCYMLQCVGFDNGFHDTLHGVSGADTSRVTSASERNVQGRRSGKVVPAKRTKEESLIDPMLLDGDGEPAGLSLLMFDSKKMKLF